MKSFRFAAPLLSFALLAAAPTIKASAASPSSPAVAPMQDQWDGPSDYSEIARRGWRDGMRAAHADWDAHRFLDPYHSAAFRRPPVPYASRQEYRNGYLRGYDMVSHQLRGWGQHDNNGWHDEHDTWRENHENWDNQPHDWDNQNHYNQPHDNH